MNLQEAEITEQDSLLLEEQLTQSKMELIISFCEAVFGANPKEAAQYLERNNWNIHQAVGCFLDECRPTPSQMKSNRPIHHRPPVGPKQGVIGSSSSSINADPTETQRLVEEDGEAPGMESSQVDDVEDDSSMETSHDSFAIQEDRAIVGTETAPITITIVLADGGSGVPIDLPFRSNETVRDIRDAIDERTPDSDRDYYLLSIRGVEYRDMDTSVFTISSGGSTNLLQVFPDPDNLTETEIQDDHDEVDGGDNPQDPAENGAINNTNNLPAETEIQDEVDGGDNTQIAAENGAQLARVDGKQLARLRIVGGRRIGSAKKTKKKPKVLPESKEKAQRAKVVNDKAKEEKKKKRINVEGPIP